MLLMKDNTRKIIADSVRVFTAIGHGKSASQTMTLIGHRTCNDIKTLE